MLYTIRQEERKTVVGVIMQTTDTNVHCVWTAVVTINPISVLVKYECLVVSWKQFSILTQCTGYCTEKRGENSWKNALNREKSKEETMWGEVIF